MLEGKRLLGILRRGLKFNIKINLREMGPGGMDWIDLAQDSPLANTVMNLRVTENNGKFLGSGRTGGFSGRTQFHGVSLLVGYFVS
jgi:hypothetical protein